LHLVYTSTGPAEVYEIGLCVLAWCRISIVLITILSSVGSGIHLIDHVTTQIPYAIVCAAASLAGYVVLGFTRNIAVGLLTTLAALAVAVFVLRTRFASETPREAEAERVAG
jgi:tetracycline resistance efflux pump